MVPVSRGMKKWLLVGLGFMLLLALGVRLQIGGFSGDGDGAIPSQVSSGEMMEDSSETAPESLNVSGNNVARKGGGGVAQGSSGSQIKEPLAQLIVHVLDRDGNNISGAPIVLRRAYRGMPMNSREVARTISGEDGLAIFEQIQIGLGGDVNGVERGYWDYFVVADIPFENPAVVEPVLEWFETIQMMLPPVGWLSVVLGQYEQVEGGAPFEMSLLWSHVAGSGQKAREVVSTVSVQDGSPVKIGPFGLGLKLSLKARSKDFAGWLGGEVVEGPNIPFGVKRVILPLEACSIVRGRAVDPEGLPLVDARLQIVFETIESKRVAANCRTDSDGAWLVRVTRAHSFDKVDVKTDEIGAPKMHGTALLGISKLQPEYSLGDVVLDKAEGIPPLVVGGWVVDNDGVPIRSARVSIFSKDFRGGVSVLGRERTDGKGEFSIRREIKQEQRKVWVRASAKGYTPSSPRNVDVGSYGFDIILERNAGIDLRFGLDPWVSSEAILVFVEQGDSLPRVFSLRDVVFGGHLKQLKIGNYTLTFRVDGSELDLHRETVSVDGDGITKLMVDLRGKTKVFSRKVVDSKGAVSEGRKFRISTTSGVVLGYLHTNHSGEIYCLIPESVEEVRLESVDVGYYPSSVLATGSDDLIRVSAIDHK